MVKKIQQISNKAKQLLKYLVVVSILIEIFEFAIAKLDKLADNKTDPTQPQNPQ